jgi:hypothetical protein
MAISMEYKVQQAFTMIRSGILPEDMIPQVVEGIVPSKQKVAVKTMCLYGVIEKYVAAKQHEWTEKSKMEFGCVLKLLKDILGDVEVKSITRAMVLELRSTLMKLPTNMYKKFPGKAIQEILSTKHTELLSIKSVNKHVSRLGAILRYCVDEGLITSNAASGLKISENKRVDEERRGDTLNTRHIVLVGKSSRHCFMNAYWAATPWQSTPWPFLRCHALCGFLPVPYATGHSRLSTPVPFVPQVPLGELAL